MTPHLQEMLNRRLLWVGGKGGVGKTTVAAALGIVASRQDIPTLVVSTDPAHSLGDAFGRELNDSPRRLLPNLDALELDPDLEVEAHLERVMAQMRRFASAEMIPELERQMRLTRLSPGAQEAAMLERIARLVCDDDPRYGLIIFDTAPTGHTLRLLSLPEAMAAWTEGLVKHNRKSAELGKVLQHLAPGTGRDISSPFAADTGDQSDLDKRTSDITSTLLARRRLFHRTRRLLTDPEASSFLFVLTPERLPVLETCRAVQSLGEAKIPVGGVIANRVIPAGAGGDFLAARRRQEAVYLEEIRQQLGHLPRGQLPLLESDINGLAGLDAVASLLEEMDMDI